jgi:dTDP-4-amino-4,6-dideoxygalactose transaminase
VRRICNFGLNDGRVVDYAGINAKMSEYTAAVGLAELDWWPEKRKLWEDAQKRYESALGNNPLGYVRSLNPVTMNNARAAVKALNDQGIGARRIWGDGCHTHKPYIHCAKFPMPETKRLCDTVITLPFYIGMTDEEMDIVAKAVSEL